MARGKPAALNRAGVVPPCAPHRLRCKTEGAPELLRVQEPDHLLHSPNGFERLISDGRRNGAALDPFDKARRSSTNRREAAGWARCCQRFRMRLPPRSPSRTTYVPPTGFTLWQWLMGLTYARALDGR